MPRSELAQALDGLQRALRPRFSARGFRARARTFHRRTEDGLIQVVAFQMGRHDPPGAQQLPGLRERLYGRFTLGLGVWIPEAVAHGCGWGDGRRVGEADCTLRARIGALSGDRRDLWWCIAREDPQPAQVVEDVGRRLERDVFPFLDALASREALLARWPRFAAEMDTSAGSPWRVVCAILHAARGERGPAAQLLREQAGPGGASDWLRRLAARLDVPLA